MHYKTPSSPKRAADDETPTGTTRAKKLKPSNRPKRAVND